MRLSPTVVPLAGALLLAVAAPAAAGPLPSGPVQGPEAGLRILTDQPMAAPGGAAQQRVVLSNGTGRDIGALTFSYRAPSGFAVGNLPRECAHRAGAVSCTVHGLAKGTARAVTIPVWAQNNAAIGQTDDGKLVLGTGVGSVQRVWGIVLQPCAPALPDAQAAHQAGQDAVEAANGSCAVAPADAATSPRAIAAVQNLVVRLPEAGAADEQRAGDMNPMKDAVNWFGDPVYHFVSPTINAGALNHSTHIPAIGRLLGCYGSLGGYSQQNACSVTQPNGVDQQTLVNAQEIDSLFQVGAQADDRALHAPEAAPIRTAVEEEILGFEVAPATKPGVYQATSTVTNGHGKGSLVITTTFTITVLPADAPMA